MSKYQRPWWLLVYKPVGLITAIKEETTTNGRTFTIRGKPLVQGLAWLIWGPIVALLCIVALVGVAIIFEVNQQSLGVRFVVAVGLLLLPALAWAITAIIANRLSVKHLQAEQEAETETCVIQLNQKQGEFLYRTSALSTDQQLNYNEIAKIRVAPVLGGRDNGSIRLILETSHGPIVLLHESLGTQTQKMDLAQELDTAIQNR